MACESWPFLIIYYYEKKNNDEMNEDLYSFLGLCLFQANKVDFFLPFSPASLPLTYSTHSPPATRVARAERQGMRVYKQASLYKPFKYLYYCMQIFPKLV